MSLQTLLVLSRATVKIPVLASCQLHQGFSSDPFDLASPALLSLQTGLSAYAALVRDFESAQDDGEKMVKSFFEERMFSNDKPFDATVHRNSRCNFSKPPIVKDGSTTTVTKTDAMENKAIAEIIFLAKRCNDTFDLIQVMDHRVTDECLSIFDIDGTMRKGQKSKLLEKLQLVELPMLHPYIALTDMGFLWRLESPTTDDIYSHDGKMYTWGDYADYASSCPYSCVRQ